MAFDGRRRGKSVNNVSLLEALSIVMLRIDCSSPYSLRDSATFSARYSPVCDFVNLNHDITQKYIMSVTTAHIPVTIKNQCVYFVVIFEERYESS